MKQKILLFIYLIAIIQVGYSQTYQAKTFTLSSNNPTGNVEYQARENIKLTHGFHFKADASNSFKGVINDFIVTDITDDYLDASVNNDQRTNPDYNLPVGTLPGQAGVSPTGGATYNIPIQVPPGTNGMQPNISLVYNSQGGNGIMGLGWGLSGLSAITTVSENFYQHGDNDGINSKSNRKLALDGQYLVQTNVGYVDKQYVIVANPTTKIVSYTATDDANDLYYVAETKDGTIMEYGYTPDSRIEMAGSSENDVNVWNINKITDKYGNYMTFHYHEDIVNGEFWLERIDYSGNVYTGLLPYNSIHFIYDNNRSDAQTYYKLGHKITQSVLLTEIRNYVDDEMVNSYQLNYFFDTYSKLASVDAKIANQSISNTINIKWENITTGITLKEISNLDSSHEMFSADMNNDGLTDLILINYEYDGNGKKYYDKISLYYASLNGADAVFNLEKHYTLPEHCEAYTLKPGDFDGDGFTDLCEMRLNNGTYKIDFLLGGANGLNRFSYGTTFTETTVIQVLDYNGDGKDDVSFNYISSSDNKIYNAIASLKSDRSEWVFISNAPDVDWRPVFAGNFDTDNSNELFAFTSTGYKIIFAEQFYSGTEFNSTDNRLFPADFNGDGLTDILSWKSGTGWEIYTFTGKNWELNKIAVPALRDYDPNIEDYGTEIIFGDYNGDGLIDILEVYSVWVNGKLIRIEIYNIFVHFQF